MSQLRYLSRVTQFPKLTQISGFKTSSCNIELLVNVAKPRIRWDREVKLKLFEMSGWDVEDKDFL